MGAGARTGLPTPISGGCGEKNLSQRRQGAKSRGEQVRSFRAGFSDLAPSRERLLLARGSFRDFTWLGRTTPSRLDRRATQLLFSDKRQRGEQATKKMLKMQIAPNILLKTKERETENLVLANMFMKASRLRVLPISCREGKRYHD
jgi:hypothetical protein